MINEIGKKWLFAAMTLCLFALPLQGLQGAMAQGDSRTFPETGMTVKGRFLTYWLSNGELAQQGYPITEERQEISPTDGKLYTVQYFERSIFEAHPQNAQPYDVLLSLLGIFRYSEKYPKGAPDQDANNEPGSVHFPETGMRLGGTFLDYWQRNGGLAQQGYPISNEFTEVSDLDGKPYRVQYFERAVFERHPENRLPYDMLLSQLGTLRLRQVQEQASGAGSLKLIGEMSVGRACHSSTLLGNGKVLIAGGMERDNVVTSSVEMYDPVTGKFTPAGDMTSKRVCHAAVTLANGKVLIVGGFGTGLLSSAELYDPATGKFTATGSMKEKRGGFTATLLKGGKVLITGGSDSAWYASAELYDPASGTFTFTGNMTTPRAAHTATLLPDGKVLLAGGSSSRTEVLASAEIYDPAKGTFTATGSMATARHKHAAEMLPNGKVLIAGGSDIRDWRGRYSSAEIYDAETGEFTATGSMLNPRFKSREAIVPLKDGRLLVAGGGKLVEIYDAQAGKFAAASGEVDADRFYTAATALPDGRVLITGGYDYDIVSGKKAWLYVVGR
ncbi:MAG TPA: kelch repeat-containing protein [Chloroflexia bacterium]|nr:kelch repeat-containing protein [Chloroflexia bacterium]